MLRVRAFSTTVLSRVVSHAVIAINDMTAITALMVAMIACPHANNNSRQVLMLVVANRNCCQVSTMGTVAVQ